MVNKKGGNKLIKRIFKKVQKLSVNKPSEIKKEGVTVIEDKNKVYVYVMKKKKK